MNRDVIKKGLLIVVMLLLGLFLLAGCGGGNGTEETTTPEGTSESTAASDDGEDTGSGHPSSASVEELLPTEDPYTSSNLYGYDIAAWVDGTFSINNGIAIILPDGTIYINGNLAESNGPMAMPTEGVRSTYKNGGVLMVGHESDDLFLEMNGSILLLGENGDIRAYTLQE